MGGKKREGENEKGEGRRRKGGGWTPLQVDDVGRVDHQFL